MNLDDFLLRAALAGAGAAVAAAPLSVFVVWRKMAYFGEATAHASVLGVVLGLATGLPVFPGAALAALAMAASLLLLSRHGHAHDTALGVLAHSALALALTAAAFLTGQRLDLMAWLVGDILSVTRVDLALIWSGALVVIGLLAWRWQGLLTATLSRDLAHASDLDPDRDDIALTLGLALVVAVAIKVVGVLLIAALLVIPPATARPFARTPEAMAAIAALVGLAAAQGGLGLSLLLDTPTGPTIVAVAAGLFALSLTVGRLGAHRG